MHLWATPSLRAPFSNFPLKNRNFQLRWGCKGHVLCLTIPWKLWLRKQPFPWAAPSDLVVYCHKSLSTVLLHMSFIYALTHLHFQTCPCYLLGNNYMYVKGILQRPTTRNQCAWRLSLCYLCGIVQRSGCLVWVVWLLPRRRRASMGSLQACRAP